MAHNNNLLKLTRKGLFCEKANFYIDPWGKVDRALITHAHADHARTGSRCYLAADSSKALLHKRLGKSQKIESLPYGQKLQIGEVSVSFYPAGHVLGSAQILVEYRGQRWLVTGDFKRQPDPSCTPFEVVKCDTLITEATFGLPVFQWQPIKEQIQKLAYWWKKNAENNVTSMVFAYSLGKTQRILAELKKHQVDMGPIYLHGAGFDLTQIYRQEGVDLPEFLPATIDRKLQSQKQFEKALVLAPPSALDSPWMKRFRSYSTAFASGWMQFRGRRRYQAYDLALVISDHADWPALLQTVRDSGAQKIIATHGYHETLARYLQEQGYQARSIKTEFVGEDAHE